MIVYKELFNPPEFKAVIDLQMRVWSLDAFEAVPSYMFTTFVHNSGSVIGAYDGDQLVGFTLASPERRGDHWFIWSHMAGVHPAYQSQGIGFGLKQAQRIWALKEGYTHMYWTYDPLRKGNANFNLRRLGGTSHIYYPNFYGDMEDGLNAGMPSDRLEIDWELDDPHVEALAKGALPTEPHYAEIEFLLSSDEAENISMTQPSALNAEFYGVEIPFHLDALKQSNIEKAKAWQSALSQVMQATFNNGYEAIDFVIHQQKCWYILKLRN